MYILERRSILIICWTGRRFSTKADHRRGNGEPDRLLPAGKIRNLIVFSDAYFEEAHREVEEGPTQLVLAEVPEENQEQAHTYMEASGRPTRRTKPTTLW